MLKKGNVSFQNPEGITALVLSLVFCMVLFIAPWPPMCALPDQNCL